MNNSRNVRRPRPQNRGKNSAVVTRAELRRENRLIENGLKLRPLPHPTDFQAIPWFPLTVQIQNFSTIHYGDQSTGSNISIFVALRSQLSLPAATALQIRVQSVRAWGPVVAMNSATPLQPLRMRFYTLNQYADPNAVVLGSAVLEETISYPDQVSRASLGFVWPKAQQSLALVTAFSSLPITDVVTTPATGNLAYVRLLFRTIEQP